MRESVAGALKVIHLDVIKLLRLEGDGRAVGLRRAAGCPSGDQQLAIDPQLRALLGDGGEGVSLAVFRLHATGPTRGEIGLTDGRAGAGAAPIEIHHRVGARQRGRGGEIDIGESRAGSIGPILPQQTGARADGGGIDESDAGHATVDRAGFGGDGMKHRRWWSGRMGLCKEGSWSSASVPSTV